MTIGQLEKKYDEIMNSKEALSFIGGYNCLDNKESLCMLHFDSDPFLAGYNIDLIKDCVVQFREGMEEINKKTKVYYHDITDQISSDDSVLSAFFRYTYFRKYTACELEEKKETYTRGKIKMYVAKEAHKTYVNNGGTYEYKKIPDYSLLKLFMGDKISWEDFVATLYDTCKNKGLMMKTKFNVGDFVYAILSKRYGKNTYYGLSYSIIKQIQNHTKYHIETLADESAEIVNESMLFNKVEDAFSKINELLFKTTILDNIAVSKDQWRLPTRSELMGAYKNKIDGFREDYYWSSATLEGYSDYAWYVGFYDGYDGWSTRGNDLCVRLVKGGDKLEWHKDTKHLDWNDAQDYVNKLNAKGLSDV